MTSKNIYTKLLAAQAALGVLEKKENPQGGIKYKFVDHDQVTTKAREVFHEQGLLCLCDIVEANFEQVETERWDNNAGKLVEKSDTEATVKIKIEIINIENPTEKIITHSAGQGIDNGDKAFGKAYSYAFKYGLLKLLMASTGVDSDNEQVNRKPSTKFNPKDDDFFGKQQYFIKVAKNEADLNKTQDFIKSSNKLNQAQKADLQNFINSKRMELLGVKHVAPKPQPSQYSDNNPPAYFDEIPL